MGAWERLVEVTHEQFPAAAVMNFDAPMPIGTLFLDILAELDGMLTETRRHLHRLAYPDARELEPDPDAAVEAARERRKAPVRLMLTGRRDP